LPDVLGSWSKPRRVIAKVEWHPGELYPRVGFIVTNMSRPAERVVAFYNKRGTCEQWIKEGKGAIKWTRLSCRTFAANAVRLQLHALAYNLGNFLRTLATPEPIKDWSLTSLKEKLIKIGAKVVSHGRYVAFQMAEVAIPWQMFQEIFAAHRRTAAAATTSASVRRSMVTRSKSNRREECVQVPGKWPDQTLEHRLGRPGMPFFESGLSASSEQDYHSRQFGFIREIPAQVGRD
jgi:Transposase DDE domain group 1